MKQCLPEYKVPSAIATAILLLFLSLYIGPTIGMSHLHKDNMLTKVHFMKLTK